MARAIIIAASLIITLLGAPVVKANTRTLHSANAERKAKEQVPEGTSCSAVWQALTRKDLALGGGPEYISLEVPTLKAGSFNSSDLNTMHAQSPHLAKTWLEGWEGVPPNGELRTVWFHTTLASAATCSARSAMMESGIVDASQAQQLTKKKDPPTYVTEISRAVLNRRRNEAIVMVTRDGNDLGTFSALFHIKKSEREKSWRVVGKKYLYIS